MTSDMLHIFQEDCTMLSSNQNRDGVTEGMLFRPAGLLTAGRSPAGRQRVFRPAAGRQEYWPAPGIPAGTTAGTTAGRSYGRSLKDTNIFANKNM